MKLNQNAFPEVTDDQLTPWNIVSSTLTQCRSLKQQKWRLLLHTHMERLQMTVKYSRT